MNAVWFKLVQPRNNFKVEHIQYTMSTPYSYVPPTPTTNGAQFASILSSASFDQSQPSTPTAGRGRPRGSAAGAKRGRKPRGASAAAGASSPRPFVANTFSGSSPTMTPATFASSSSTTPNQYSRVHWASSAASGASGDNTSADPIVGDASATNPVDSSATTMPEQNSTTSAQLQTSTPTPVIDPALIGAGGSRRGTPALDGPSGLQLPGATTAQPLGRTGTLVGEDDGEQDDELLPAMADDDYSAQLSFQSQSKDNLKFVACSIILNFQA